jgi:hypothetical protein
MTNQGSSAEAVSRTVWLLGQLRGFTSKQRLADAMGWDRSRLSRTLSGDRQWTIEDLETAAEALGLSGPGELFRPLAELVGAITPTASSSGGVTGRDTFEYLTASSVHGDGLAQVIPIRPGYQTVTASPHTTPQPVTHMDAGQRGRRADSA